ncbi:MAG: GDSL-type esterase/lipase family protein [Firmicutes bacterium]|nr:GDSL-type esterase/lipase family protein [Bacillota bacterium]
MTKYANAEITIFGDSNAAGMVLNNFLPVRLGINAAAKIAGALGAVIINRSAFGQTLKRANEKRLLERYIRSENNGKVRIAVIGLGGNDSDYDWEAVAADPYFPHDCKTNLYEFISMLDQKIKALKENGIKPVLMTPVPVDSENYFNNVISQKYNGANILKFFSGDINVIARHQEVYSNEIIKAAVRNNCRLLDIRSKLLWHGNLRSLMHNDGIHLNEAGQEFVAKTIMDMLED